MVESQNKSLFFIKSPDHKLSAIELFLKKRNYTVHIESDIKEALIKVIEKQPDFVFLALDHPNSKISSLPGIINQSLKTQIIPFVHSNSREDMRKLDYSHFQYKIYPPMSGPAIERLILKTDKEKMLAELGPAASAQENKFPQYTKTKDEMIQIRSKAVEKFELITREETNDNEYAQKIKQPGFIIQKGVASGLLKTKNDFFAKTQKKPIAADQIINLKEDFKNRIKTDLSDVFETYHPLQTEHETNVVPLEPAETKAYCLLIQSEIWCGYLISLSDIPLEPHLLEPIFKNWVDQHFKEIDTESGRDFVEIEIRFRDFKPWIQSKSDYFEILKVNNSEFVMGFMGINPSELHLPFDEENELIEVELDLVPLDQNLDFSLHLHLPENKKFLLYTPLNQKMSLQQKQRLANKKVEKLYVPIEFEGSLRKIRIKKYLNNLIDDIKKDLTV